ncbi:MAG: hypothetical protein IJG83_07425 [Thermoguttaceae bacterium]|nr:hypothetical protein [Thermoguttaceae bacterium]
MTKTKPQRYLAAALLFWALAGFCAAGLRAEAPYKAIRFKVDVTPPVGLDLAYCPNNQIDMPIYVGGIILDDGAARVVWCTCDYIYVCGETYEDWQKKIAEAAGCPPENVFLHSVHQHDSMRVAPEYNPPDGAVDDDGNRIPLEGSDPDYVAKSIGDITAEIARLVAENAWVPIAELKTAETRVGGLASNRRILNDEGVCYTSRSSMVLDPAMQALPTGVIDPMLRTVALVKEDGSVYAALHFYATHPQSAYLRGMVSGDVPGWAVRYACQKTPDTLHFYFTGCAGNVTVGKYNPSAGAAAIVTLGTRLGEYLVRNLDRLEDRAVGPIRLFCVEINVPLDPARANPEHLAWGMRAYFEKTFDHWKRSSITRFNAGEVNILSFGLSEICVEYQLYAQALVPENFLATAAYGNGIYWYMPLAKAFDEKGYESCVAACLVTPEIEPVLKAGIREALAELIAHPGWTGAPKK